MVLPADLSTSIAMSRDRQMTVAAQLCLARIVVRAGLDSTQQEMNRQQRNTLTVPRAPLATQTSRDPQAIALPLCSGPRAVAIERGSGETTRPSRVYTESRF